MKIFNKMVRVSFMGKIMKIISDRERLHRPMKAWNTRYIRPHRRNRYTSCPDSKRLIDKIRKFLEFISGNDVVSMLSGLFLILNL